MSEKAKETNTKNRNKILSIVYIGVSAALIAICSWIQIPLTVPITLQTMGVCLVSGLLGLKRGTLATLVYIVLGAIGVPRLFGRYGRNLRLDRRIHCRLYIYSTYCRFCIRQIQGKTYSTCYFNGNRYTCLLRFRHSLVCSSLQ